MTTPKPLEKVLYTAQATAIGGRQGSVKSNDSTINMPVVRPKEMGGKGEPGTNPEQLFAAGYSACFGSALDHVAKLQRVRTGPVSITASVSIGPVGQGFGLAVELTGSIPELPREQAQAMMEAAHQVCPYSNATRGNIVVTLKLA